MVDLKRRAIDTVVRLNADRDRQDRFLSHLRRAARIGKYLAPAPGHRRQLQKLETAIEENYPVVELIRRLASECNESALQSVARLFVDHAWEGYRQRTKLEKEYQVSLPSFIVISPLALCNLSCTGCYAGAYGDQEPHLSYAEIESLIEEARGWGSRFVTISGGEPTTFWRRIPGDDRGLRDLFAQFDDTMFLMYTNGTLIDDAMASDIAELGNVAPGISVEGFQEQTDERRGDGVFDRVMQAMARLHERGALFGASVTYTTRNWRTVTSDEFVEMLINRGCMYAWYFMYIPVGREPDLSLTVSPQQRRKVAETTWRWTRTRPIFVADFWNSGPLTQGCIAAGRSGGYLHVTHRGDITPCVFMMYSAHNMHEMDSDTPLLDAVRSDFFAKIREGQKKKQHNPLAPCQIVDHPEVLKEAVETTDAHDTQEGQRIITDLHDDVARRAAEWEEIANQLWTRSGEYTGFEEAYSEDGWIQPG